ncbi:MAG: hypothetical protein II155_07205, partial [Clostridia bacterium]|nr:hypothetical protein [Clostridia bacterium]
CCVENARKTLRCIPKNSTSFSALFALHGAKISSFETLRGFQPKYKRNIRGYELSPDIFLSVDFFQAENLHLLK